MGDKKIEEKEAREIKKNKREDNRLLDKKKEIMKSTHLKVEDVFGVVSGEIFFFA